MSSYLNSIFSKEGKATKIGESEVERSRKRTSYKREIIFLFVWVLGVLYVADELWNLGLEKLASDITCHFLAL